MAVLLVTYDLQKPGQNYQPVYDYLKQYSYCKGLESVWLLDTTASTQKVRDDLVALVDDNDKIFVVRLRQDWHSWNYYCADWLNKPERKW